MVENDDEPINLGGISVTSKEFRADFATPEARLDAGLSLDRRPDAISYDYLTCFSLGPIQLGDFSAGPVNRAWKIHVAGNTVYSAREASGGGFEPEEVVFSFDGVGATEIDAAFDQSAHILVCMERPTGVSGSPEIWIYYYDPFLTDYALTNFGRGRTPRAVLDDILDSSNADILVFYLADSVGMCWRQQRERYLVERVVSQVAPTLPDTGLMTMVGPVTWAYDYPANLVSGVLGYTIHETDPTPYTGPAMDIFTAYPRNLGVSISSGYGTLRVIEETGGKPVYYPGVGFSGVLEDPTVIDYGPWTGTRDYGATIQFTNRVYYAEVEMYKSFYGGARLRALDGTTVVAEYLFDASPDATTRELGIVYHQLGFTRLQIIPSSQDSSRWSNVRYSESQIPGPTVPTDFDFPNTYIEDVYKSTSGRVVIIYSVRDPVLGKYSLNTIATVLYPYVMETENWQALNTLPLSGVLNKALMYILPPGELDPAGDVPAAYDEIDLWKVLAALPLSGDLHDIVILHTLYDVDEWKANTAIPLSGVLLVVIVLHTLYDVDDWKVNTAIPTGGLLFLAVILHSLYDDDPWKVNAAIPTSGTLV